MLRRDSRGCLCPRCVVDGGIRVRHGRWIEMMSLFNERQARLYAAEKAMAFGHGGITLVSQVLGLSERTIRRGIEELEAGNLAETPERSRRPGGGRKLSEAVDPSVVSDLELLMGETTAGDPMRLLKWTTKSLRSIARGIDSARARCQSPQRCCGCCGSWIIRCGATSGRSRANNTRNGMPSFATCTSR